MTEFESLLCGETNMVDAGDLLKDNTWIPDSDDDLWSFGGGLAANDNFLEVFADLSDSCDFLFEGSITPNIPPVATSAVPFSTLAEIASKNEPVASSSSEPLSVILPPQVATPVDKKCATKKRTVSEAFSSVLDSNNPDHDDYTAKFMKPAVIAETPVSSVEKHSNRRVKNNVASRQSRLNRKQKYVDLDDQALKLVTENEELRKKAEKMEELTKEMKRILVEKMVQKK